MKKILLSAMLATICLSPVFAQNKTPKHERVTPEKMVQRMDRALDLNEQQEQEMLNIYTSMFENRKNMKDATREERITKHKEMNEKIMQILTKEQLVKWEKIKMKSRNQSYKNKKVKNHKK